MRDASNRGRPAFFMRREMEDAGLIVGFPLKAGFIKSLLIFGYE
jgi:hypothetical protein